MGLFRPNRIRIPGPGGDTRATSPSSARQTENTSSPSGTKPSPTSSPSGNGREVKTCLGPDAVIHGRLSFATPTRLEGRLVGEVYCSSLLVVGPMAIVEGTLQADEVRIMGLLRGEVRETRRVEIGSTGRVHGRIRTTALVIREGGLCDADVHMTRTEEARTENDSSSPAVTTA